MIKEKDEWGQLNPQNEFIVQDYLKSVKEKTCSCYMITISRDDEYPERSVIFYDNIIDAVNVYNSYIDWGFAKSHLTIRMYEPNGNVHTKIFKRPPGIDSVFMRKEYIEIQEAILQLKNKLNDTDYQNFVFKIAKVFSRDNMRFNPSRFIKNLIGDE
jgi:hypothetical protein